MGAAAGLGFCFAPLSVASVEAAQITKPIAQDCHSNGVPLNFNADLLRDGDTITITTPDSVKVGEEYTIKVDYRPELVPGKQQGADVVSMNNIVVRFAINNPEAFVTAKIVGEGKSLTTKPKMALVGGNRLVFSNMNVTLNGKDTVWAPPAFEMTFKALKEGDLPTIHQYVEGPAGQRNNPENWMTMDNNVDHPLIGKKTLPMNCMAIAKGGGKPEANLASVKAVAAPGAPTTAENEAAEGEKKDDATKSDEATASSTSAAVESDENGLERVDTDIYADQDSVTENSGMPGWGIALIVIVVLAAAGGIGYGVYRAQQKKKGNA